ncbi:hypothetical protein FFWV33_10500 [Flavobacterium faecale]|uniref:Uncharacterized protein n=1 Tax=Flavobacterium faecale TaxID=1355330 RepID=A0A2S1LDU4_9FLAO|nr:hypothetical protein [Flavobacterium faecale]AWG21923.1 hypothetical protein FFWV33_10500 [Flavobacterium faecale]
MGWNTSLIIIENREHFSDEVELLKILGFKNFEYKEDTSFDAILNPKENQIGIGYYNGNIILCDGYILTSKSLEGSENLNLVEYEKSLVKIFPDSEIVTVSCASSVNFHGYSLIQKGERKRLKYVDSEIKQEWGNRFEEEVEIYKDSHIENEQLLWKYDDDIEESFTEDQLMEDFTFKIAKRRLGVQIDNDEGDDLFKNTPFRVYQLQHLNKNQDTKSSTFEWKRYLLLALLMIIVKIIFKFIYKN